MKFIHTSDLHIGKTVNDFSMLEEQKYVLAQIQDIAAEEKADAVIIAGDVYDRSIPSTEAVELLDDFLTGLLADGIKVIMISGNHDSAERVAFADRILEKQGLYIAGGYDGTLRQAEFYDELGQVTFVCLPFVKPALMDSKSSQEAVQKILEAWRKEARIAKKEKGMHRFVLVTHFFVTGEEGRLPELSDSETTVHVGGLDNVQADIFEDFDYVALGHIHKPQQIGRREVHYAGSPLKYSFSEVQQVKSVNVVSWGAEGRLQTVRRELKSLRQMRIIKGKLEALLAPDIAAQADREDYIQAILTDEIELIDPIGALRSVYPNVMQIILDKNRSNDANLYDSKLMVQKKSIEELFGDFYVMLKGEALDEKRTEVVRQTVADIEKEQGV